MHIDVTGQGPDLVLIHGWALQGGVFAPLVQRLADRFTLHCVDLPGHGHSREDTTPLRLPFVVNAIAAATPPTNPYPQAAGVVRQVAGRPVRAARRRDTAVRCVGWR